MKGKIAIGIGAILIIISILMMGGIIPSLRVFTVASCPSDGTIYTELTTVMIQTPKTVDYNGKTYTVYGVGFGIDVPETGQYPSLVPHFSETTITWVENITQPSVGTHTFIFSVWGRCPNPPNPDLEDEVIRETGSFTITPFPQQLKGDWYIGSTKIVSSSQKVTVPTNNVLFKFIKTSTVPADSAITCTVTWSGTASGSKTLSLSSAGVWEGTQTLQKGTYTVTMRAADETVVQMSVALGIGEEPSTGGGTPQWRITRQPTVMSIILLIAGLLALGVGIYWEKES